MRNVKNNEDKGRNHYCKSTSSADQMGYNIMLELVNKALWPKFQAISVLSIYCCVAYAILPAFIIFSEPSPLFKD